jgi:hypothetical protein
MKIDFFCFGVDSLSLVLFFGDLAAVRKGFAKVNDAQKHILARVKQGEAAADGCARKVQTILP